MEAKRITKTAAFAECLARALAGYYDQRQTTSHSHALRMQAARLTENTGMSYTRARHWLRHMVYDLDAWADRV